MSQRGAILAVAVPLLVFKVWAAILLLVLSPDGAAVAAILATHWALVPIAVFLVAGPTVAWYRLVRVRARRERLRRAEWMVGSPRPAAAPLPGTRGQWPLWETVSRLERGD